MASNDGFRHFSWILIRWLSPKKIQAVFVTIASSFEFSLVVETFWWNQ
jgi:hypothetical protein